VKRRDIGELVALAAIWGAAFLFMRVGAPEFGAVPLAGVRVTGATLVLLPLLVARGEARFLLKHWKPILLIGITNSALPFMCFSFAVLYITAGLSGIFNAGAPLFAAAIAWLWLKDKLNASRTLGLVIGFVGVFGLAYSKAGLKAEDGVSVALAVLACLVGTFAYGFSANFAKRYLSGVPPMVVAAGSQLGASLALIVPTVLLWPAELPGAAAWVNVLLLAVLCTGVAYILYFRLIAHTGPANAITVTFLIPGFAVAWGAMFLGETLTWQMVLGCGVILLGTALATGVLRPSWPARKGSDRTQAVK
jgi:drug/metabolite transporter (DMT)-like permease